MIDYMNQFKNEMEEKSIWRQKSGTAINNAWPIGHKKLAASRPPCPIRSAANAY